MKNRASIKELFYMNFCFLLFMMIFSFAFLIFICFSLSSFVDAFDKFGTVIYIILIVFLIVILGILIINMVPCFKELKYIKTNSCLEIEGEVIGFKKNKDPESGTQVNSLAIIKYGNDEKIVLKVNDFLKINTVYTFIYLPNTKTAKVKK